MGVRKPLSLHSCQDESQRHDSSARLGQREPRTAFSVSSTYCFFIPQTYSGPPLCAKEAPVQTQMDADSPGRNQASICQSSFTGY